jgi:hypothetical protein
MTCARGCCSSPAEHYRSISISAAATPTRRPQAVSTARAQKQMDKDHAAYRRLRAEGLQPPSTMGASLLEAKATNKFEVESGRLYGNRKGKDAAIREGLEISKAAGLPAPTL